MKPIFDFFRRFFGALTHSVNVKRAVRGAVITFATLFVPGLLGWLHDLTAWANSAGATPFPDAHGLGYLAVSAIVASCVGLVNLAFNAAETASGKGFLRPVVPLPRKKPYCPAPGLTDEPGPHGDPTL